MSEQAGCPRVYRLKYVDYKLVEPRSYPLEFGTVIHDAMFLSEEENLPILPDALEKAWSRSEVPLGPGAWEEATQMLEAYLQRPDDGLAVLAVEQELKMPLMEYKGEEWFFGGRLDRICVDPNDEGSLFVDDIKTNRAPPSQDDLDVDPQFTGYMLLARANLDKWLPGVDPDSIDIVGRMDALKWYILTTRRTQEQLDAYLDFLRAMCRKIVDDEEGEPVLNSGCGWCSVKWDCKAFLKLPGKGETVADRMSTRTSLQERTYFMQQGELILKGLKSAVDEVKVELLEEAKRTEEPVVVNGISYEAGETWETEVDTLRLMEVMGNDFLEIASAPKYRLTEWVRQHPERKDEVDACMTRRVKGERLKASRVKE